jgi:hypothetical protein
MGHQDEVGEVGRCGAIPPTEWEQAMWVPLVSKCTSISIRTLTIE